MGAVLLNRPTPSMGPEHYKTYAMSAPLRTHWRPATCEEYQCDEFLQGFATTVDVSTDLGQEQFYYLSHDKSRRAVMQRLSMTLVRFTYGPGNKCFRWGEHRVPMGRPPHLLVLSGDWRARTGPTRRHTRVEDWVDDSATHLDHLSEIRRRGLWLLPRSPAWRGLSRSLTGRPFRTSGPTSPTTPSPRPAARRTSRA